MPEWGMTLLTGLVGMISAAVGYLLARRKLSAEIHAVEASADLSEANTAREIGEAWNELLQPMRTELAGLRAEVNVLKSQLRERDEQRDKDRRLIRALEKQVAAFRAQIAELGIEPYKVQNGDE